MVAAHPVLGTGPGTFETVYNRLKPAGWERKWSAHNLWLNFAAETGLLGLLAILWVVLVAVREWVRAGRTLPPRADPIRPIVTGVLIGLFVDQWGDNTLLSVSTMSGFLLLLAMMVTPPPAVRAPEAAGDAGAREGGTRGRGPLERPMPVGAARAQSREEGSS